MAWQEGQTAMTNLLRKAIGIVLLLTLVAPFQVASPVSAQSTLDGSACWQPGQLSITGASMSWSAPPATIIDPAQSYTATLRTTAGSITVALDSTRAPIATNNSSAWRWPATTPAPIFTVSSPAPSCRAAIPPGPVRVIPAIPFPPTRPPAVIPPDPLPWRTLPPTATDRSSSLRPPI